MPPFIKKYAGLIIILILLVGGVTAALVIGGKDTKQKTNPGSQQAVNTSCGPYRKDGVVVVNGKSINVETAAGTKELVKGLSGRPCIQSNWGMLFDFGREGRYPIWMKDMKFPIDVAWINSAHRVVAMEIDFKPSTYPERRVNQAPARYVLEIAANTSKDLNMTLGTQVHFFKP